MPLVNITITSHTENHELVMLKEHREKLLEDIWDNGIL